MKYHGNYCGPNWSGGRRRASLYRGKVRPIDSFDATCRTHDTAYSPDNPYASSAGRSRADKEFFRKNIGKGFKRSAAAIAVRSQAFVRDNIGYDFSGPISSSENMAKRSRSRGRSRTVKRARGSTPFGSALRTIARSRGDPSKSRSRSVSRSTASRLASLGRNRSVSFVAKPRIARNFNAAQYKGKIKSKKRVSHKDLTTKFLSKGVIKNFEGGTSVSGIKGVCIGHCLVPNESGIDTFYMSLLKMLSKYMTQVMVNPTDIIYNVATGDNIRLHWRIDVDDATVPATVSFGLTFGVSTWQTVCSAMVSWHKLNFNSQSALLAIEYLNGGAGSLGSGKYIWLANARVTIRAKSDLKIQNRSVNGTDTTTDEVDTVPLQGKSYSGPGNYTEYSVGSLSAKKQIIGGLSLGQIAFDTTSIVELVEPPYPQIFGKVTKSSAISMAPGELKTSSLFMLKTININTYLQSCQLDAQSPQRKVPWKLGKYRFMILEKLLDLQANDDPVNLAYEINCRLAMFIHEGRKNYSPIQNVDVTI